MTLEEFVEICKPYIIGDLRISDFWEDNTEVWINYKNSGVIRYIKNDKFEGITVPYVMKICNDSILILDKNGIRKTTGWNEDQNIDINDKKTLVEKLSELNKLTKEIEIKKKLRKMEAMF